MKSGWRCELLISALVFALSLAVRCVNHVKAPDLAPDGTVRGWFTRDPDSCYHLRRVDRLLDDSRGLGLSIAATDPFLDFPHGAAIPWPPYYTAFLGAAAAPFAPQEAEARRGYLERTVGSAPAWLSALTSVLVAWAALSLAGRGAMWIAGAFHALSFGSLSYSAIGVGDHHAWVSLWLCALLWSLSSGLRKKNLRSRRASVAFGCAAGACAGVLLGSWVASLAYVAVAQLSLGLLLFQRPRDEARELPWLACAFHAAAIAAVAPALWSSPWLRAEPWSAVNLSWFHLAVLAVGLLVFGASAFASGSARASRAIPWICAAALGAAALLVLGLGLGPAREIRGALRWAGRTETFMSLVDESRPLWPWSGAGWKPFFVHLSWAAPLLPVCWAIGTRALLRLRSFELLPWLLASALLFALSLLQRRFSEALAVPTPVLFGWLFGWLAGSGAWISSRKLLAAGVAAALPFLAQAQVVRATLARAPLISKYPVDAQALRDLRLRRVFEWLRLHTPEPPDYSVLAHWHYGHAIEWVAQRPAVATNFGVYAGEQAFRDAAAFFLCEDEAEAEALLDRHGTRFVVATSSLLTNLEDLLSIAAPERRSRYLVADPRLGTRLAPAWYDTMAARLMNGGRAGLPGNQESARGLGFLRLVHAAPDNDPSVPSPHSGEPMPCAWVWERVTP